MARASSRAPIRADLIEIAGLIEPGATVLDLGCGEGDLLAYLEQTRGCRTQGIEIKPERIVDCVAKGLACCQGDIDGGLNDYADGTFDYVILSQTLHLVSRPGPVVQEMLRVARRGIVSIPNFGYWRIRLGLLLRGRVPRAGCFREPWYTTPTGHVMTLNDFRGFCAGNGITIEQQRPVAFGGPLSKAMAKAWPNTFAQLGVYVVSKGAASRQK